MSSLKYNCHKSLEFVRTAVCVCVGCSKQFRRVALIQNHQEIMDIASMYKYFITIQK
jgi:hypothetical protein